MTDTKEKNGGDEKSTAKKGHTIKKKVSTKDSNGNDVQAEVYVDPDGNPIDPPVIPEWEQRITAAQNRADEDEIADLTEQYTEARDAKVKRMHERAAA